MQTRQQLRPSDAAVASVTGSKTVFAAYSKASNCASRPLDSQSVNGASRPLESQLRMGASRPMNWPAGVALSELALNRMCRSWQQRNDPKGYRQFCLVPGPCHSAASERFGFAPRQKRCLTPRSSGAPTAGHQRPDGGTRYMFTVRALAPCRRRPLSSNVRHHKCAHG